MEFYKPGQGPNAPVAPVAGEGGALMAISLPLPPIGRKALITPNPKLKLLDQVREVMRLKHYSIRTEQSYCDWIRRYIRFHGMRSREDLMPAEAKMEQFLSDLAVNGHVAASTQNQAFNALLFLHREVLHYDLGQVNALRADRPVRVPVVLTVEEVRQVLGAMSGTPQLVAKVLYGSGLRLLEALRLRVQDIDFGIRFVTRTQPTCSSAERTFGRSRNCWGTMTFRRR